MSSPFALKKFSRHPATLPVESTAVLRLYRLRPIAKPAGCRQAAAVHHCDGGTGCTRSRLTGKTKTTSFRLSTTVGRLCFGHYDIFLQICFATDLSADHFDPLNNLRFLCKCLIQFHQFRHTVCFRESLDRESVGLHHSTVIVLVCTAQLRRHGNFIIQVCERAVRIECSRIQNRLRSLFDFFSLCFRRFRPGEVVVNDLNRIVIVAFQSSTNTTHPCHMDI